VHPALALTRSKTDITLINETLITNSKTWNYSINSMKVNIVINYSKLMKEEQIRTSVLVLKKSTFEQRNYII